MPISSKQARSARAHLNLTLQDVEKGTNVKMNSLSRFENDSGKLTSTNSELLKLYYEQHGIEFTSLNGIREVQNMPLITLSGFDGFQDFLDDVYQSISLHPEQDIVVSNVDERQFTKWFGTNGNKHVIRLTELRKKIPFTFKIIVKNGDDYFLASDYADYRWIPEDLFGSVPFYVYGTKVAILIFKNNDIYIHIINDQNVAESFRKSFTALWKQSCIPT